MVCNDGFSISIQASRDHFCTPRDDIGPYECVEAAYPSEWEDLLLPYTDSSTPVICGITPTMYVNVPANVIREMINKHGGMARRSGHLPRMVEYHSDGYQWAEAAVPPSTDSETMTIDDEEEDEGRDVGSPTSAAHVGAPPPLPPPLPPTPTMTDPQHAGIQMGDPVSPTAFMGASPIETIHENFFE